MNKKTNTIIFIVNLVIFLAMILEVFIIFRDFKSLAKVIAFFLIITLSLLVFIFMLLKKEAVMKACFSLNIFLFILVTILSIFNLCGLFKNFEDIENVKQIILDTGGWGVFTFLLLQILNIVILPIPALILHLAGAAIYGPWTAFFLSYIGVLIGSFIAYFIGRFFGKKVVIWCVGREATEKYSKIIDSRGYIAFIFMQILPFFPDDILCMIAGMTSMSLIKFSLAMVIIRPIYIFFACFFGTGGIIPFSGWGIPAWIIIFAVMAFICIMFCLQYDKLEKLLNKKKSKKGTK